MDPDRRPFSPRPDEAYSPLYWDATDRSLFQPLSRTLSVDTSSQAVNVNAVDEVPNSSWFENRIGMRPMTVSEVARGACGESRLREVGPWTVISGKPDGANPGFMIRAPDGHKYLLKFDNDLQPERASAADVVGSRLYYAAGFATPCNDVVWFKPSILTLAPTAEAEAPDGDEYRMRAADLHRAYAHAVRGVDGTVRASASRLFEDDGLGPWTYDGTSSDDPNDVVPHEHRREVRGSYVLAAWLDHVDARDQNTIRLWHPIAGRGGYVRHAFVDWGDCLGGYWSEDALLMVRSGHAYYFDLEQMAEDYAALGANRRVWEGAKPGPAGHSLGFFDVRRFIPDAWKPHYPNPAFVQRTEADAAWMARIIANVSDEMLEAVVHEARITNPVMRLELVRVLRGRRDKLLRRFLSRRSPLAWPRVEEASGERRLCLSDLSVRARLAAPQERSYRASLSTIDGSQAFPANVSRAAADRVCVDLARVNAARPVVTISAAGAVHRRLDVRVHLYRARAGEYRVAGLERPET
jgi:hypothetical protein